MFYATEEERLQPLAKTFQDGPIVSHDPQIATIIAHMADARGHWYGGPARALWSAAVDALSVERRH